MGLRETLNEKKVVVITVAGAISILVLGYGLMGMISGEPGGGPASDPSLRKVYYTTDVSSAEGALSAMFADSAAKIPPFEKDGKQAVRVRVWTADGGKTKYVSHFERYSEAGRARVAKLEQTLRAKNTPDSTVRSAVLEDLAFNGGMEIRLVDGGEWAPASAMAGKTDQRIRREGSSEPTEILPQ